MTAKKWEEVTVDPKGAGHTYRLRVPGGYLYRTVTYRYPEKHAQWDACVKDAGSLRDAILLLNTRFNNTGGREFTKEWRDQAQEIVTQTTVFVGKAPLDPEKRQAKRLEKARTGIRKSYSDYYNGLEEPLRWPELASEPKPGSVLRFPDGGMYGRV